MKFLTGINNTKEIKRLLGCGKPIKCAVAFWGEAAWNLFENSEVIIQIICNLESGATNPVLIEKLQNKSNITIKSNSKLHSKVYIVPGKKAIVGSSNVSANGLSFEGGEVNGWIEASVLIDSNNYRTLDEISNWFDEKWQSDETKDISKKMIKKAKERWGKRRHMREFGTDTANNSILNELKKYPQKFKDRNIYFAIYRERGTQEGYDTFQEVKKQLNITDKIDYWEGWNELAENTMHISLYFGPRGGFSFDGIWTMPSPKLIEEVKYKNGENGDISICFHVNEINNLKITPEDEGILEEKISELWRSQNPQSKNEAVLVSLYEARKILFK